ncbi:MAG: D-alanyl-D-alanine carboxypeptidase [Burkholderiaceae bacterium]
MPCLFAPLAALLLSSCGGSDVAASAGPALPKGIAAVMAKPRYTSAKSKWSLVVMDAKTGQLVYALEPDRLSLTGSVRKLFSVGTALDTLGPHHRFTTSVYRNGAAAAGGVLAGDLVLVASGDLTFGGRAKSDGTFDFTDFDHNEAPSFGGSGLTPQDPLAALNDLARQVRASGIQRVSGDVVIDDRLFKSFRVLNGNTLISPIDINENLIDVTVTPGLNIGDAAMLDWRPKVSGFSVRGRPSTIAPALQPDLAAYGDSFGSISLNCLGLASCAGTLSSSASLAPGTIPVGYVAQLIGTTQYVGVLKAEDPATLARIAFIDELARAGVTVTAATVARNATNRLPAPESLADSSRVAQFVSLPYSEYARLILKVSLNTGANLSLMHVGLSQRQRTREGALAAERSLLTNNMGLDPASFNFPTNGSGSPDSLASARTTAKLLASMSTRPSYAVYRQALPLLGVDGSLASVGKNVVGKEHMSMKSGATVDNGQLVAISLAGYIEAKSGRPLTFALFVNDAGPISDIGDSLQVFEDEAQIAGIVYELN